AHTIGHEAPSVRIRPPGIHRGQPMLQRQCDDVANVTLQHRRVGEDEERARTYSSHGRKGALELVRTLHIEYTFRQCVHWECIVPWKSTSGKKTGQTLPARPAHEPLGLAARARPCTPPLHTSHAHASVPGAGATASALTDATGSDCRWRSREAAPKR